MAPAPVSYKPCNAGTANIWVTQPQSLRDSVNKSGILQSLPVSDSSTVHSESLFNLGPTITQTVNSANWAMAIGYQSHISGVSPFSYTIGNSPEIINSSNSFAIGNNLEIISSSHSFAIGNSMNISSPYSFAFGNYADIDSKSLFSFAIGGTANSNGGDVNHLCHPTIYNSKWSYNFGSGKIQDSNSAIWLGHQIDNTDTNLSNDQWNIYNSAESIGLGSYHMISGGRTNIALGYRQHIKESLYSTGIGHNNEIYNSISGLVIGHVNTLHSNGSIIVGISNNIHNGKYSTAIGYNNTVSGNNSIAVGSNTNIIADNTFGISGDIYAGGSFYFKEVTGISMPKYRYLDDISKLQIRAIRNNECQRPYESCVTNSCCKGCQCAATPHAGLGQPKKMCYPEGESGFKKCQAGPTQNIYNLSLQPPNSSEVKYSDNNIIQNTSSINLTNVVCALVGAVKELKQIVYDLSSDYYKNKKTISEDVYDIQNYLTGHGNITQINSGTLNQKNIYLGISSDLQYRDNLIDWKYLKNMSQWRQFL